MKRKGALRWWQGKKGGKRNNLLTSNARGLSRKKETTRVYKCSAGHVVQKVGRPSARERGGCGAEGAIGNNGDQRIRRRPGKIEENGQEGAATQSSLSKERKPGRSEAAVILPMRGRKQEIRT